MVNLCKIKWKKYVIQKYNVIEYTFAFLKRRMRDEWKPMAQKQDQNLGEPLQNLQLWVVWGISVSKDVGDAAFHFDACI